MAVLNWLINKFIVPYRIFLISSSREWILWKLSCAGHQCRRTRHNTARHGGPYIVKHRRNVYDIHLHRSVDNRRSTADWPIVRSRQWTAATVHLLPNDDTVRISVADMDKSACLPGSRGCGHCVLCVHLIRFAVVRLYAVLNCSLLQLKIRQKQGSLSLTADSAPGVATRGVTLSTRHFRVAIYAGTLFANMTSWIFNTRTAA